MSSKLTTNLHMHPAGLCLLCHLHALWSMLPAACFLLLPFAACCLLLVACHVLPAVIKPLMISAYSLHHAARCLLRSPSLLPAACHVLGCLPTVGNLLLTTASSLLLASCCLPSEAFYVLPAICCLLLAASHPRPAHFYLLPASACCLLPSVS